VTRPIVSDADLPFALASAKAYLAKFPRMPLFTIMRVLAHDFALPWEPALNLLLEINEKQAEPWSEYGVEARFTTTVRGEGKGEPGRLLLDPVARLHLEEEEVP
jgi:hypothetical protein